MTHELRTCIHHVVHQIMSYRAEGHRKLERGERFLITECPLDSWCEYEILAGPFCAKGVTFGMVVGVCRRASVRSHLSSATHFLGTAALGLFLCISQYVMHS